MNNPSINYLNCVLKILRSGLVTTEEAKILYSASRIQERLIVEPGISSHNIIDAQKSLVNECKIMFLDPTLTN